jgi:hypothetical protein
VRIPSSESVPGSGTLARETAILKKLDRHRANGMTVDLVAVAAHRDSMSPA